MAESILQNNARCHEHRREQAGWRCKVCGKYLCPTCTARVVTQFFCCLCEGEATQLSTHRSLRPYASWLIDAVTYPFRRGIPALLMVALGLVLASYATVLFLDPKPKEGQTELTPAATGDAGASTVEKALSPIVFPAFRALVIFLYVFVIAATMARGGRREPFKFLMLFKAILTTLVVWVPGVVYLVLLQRGLPTASTFTEPLPWLYVGLSVVFLPMATVAAAADSPLGDLVNPFRLFRWAGRIGGRYWLTVAALIGMGAVAVRFGALGGQIASSVQTPIFGRFLAEWVSLVAFVMIGRLTGWLLFVHGEAFDWGLARDFLDPVLKVDAQGTRRRTELGAESEGQAAAGAAAPVKEKPEPLAAKDVIRAIEDDNFTRALKLYGARATWDPTRFNDRQLFDLAAAAARARNNALAERLYLAASDKPGPLASRSMLALAKLYEDALKAPEKAAAVYGRVVEKFPGSDQAKVAENKLKGT